MFSMLTSQFQNTNHPPKGDTQDSQPPDERKCGYGVHLTNLVQGTPSRKITLPLPAYESAVYTVV